MTVTADPAATAAAKPAKLPREQDPRNPNHRLAALFDEGTELIARTTAAACWLRA
jgi:acetyl-CoA/propionyl-CoA carboxylase carboxyl transferase subunit